MNCLLILTTILAALLFTAGCTKSAPATSTTAAPAPSVANNARQATLAQQKMCADQAQRSFNESDFSKPKKTDTENYQYTSHYDAAANVCYIMVSGTYNGNGKPAASDVVYDAFEGRMYANYVWINTQNKKYWEVPPMICSVKPRGGDEIICHSSDEFETLIDKYFGIGR
jgi:hypothetical protein